MDAEAIWAECSALQACDHPAIPQWLGIVNADAPGRAFGERPRVHRAPYFIVEEFIPGSSLAFWLRKQRHVFGMQEIRSIGLQLLDALEHLEQRGIVHGDLRPANILYDGERVSLIDFGLSEHIGFLFAKGANGGFASAFDGGFVIAPDIASPAEASPAGAEPRLSGRQRAGTAASCSDQRHRASCGHSLQRRPGGSRSGSDHSPASSSWAHSR